MSLVEVVGVGVGVGVGDEDDGCDDEEEEDCDEEEDVDDAPLSEGVIFTADADVANSDAIAMDNGTGMDKGVDEDGLRWSGSA